MWGLKEWVGEFFAPKTPARSFLKNYAKVFNSVEGNTTFYGVPNTQTVSRWRNEVPSNFRFCFKMPRSITHDCGLVNTNALTSEFLGRLEPIAQNLGPVFVQLPPHFDSGRFQVLANFLRSLPSDFSYALEVRHPSYYSRETETRLVDLLTETNIDRVVLDSRVLHRSTNKDPWILESQRRKPNLPVRRRAIGKHPFVRIIGDNDPDTIRPCLQAWAKVCGDWICEGRQPYVFLHSPNDFFAPRFSRMFHDALKTHLDVGQMPLWPTQTSPKQPTLFANPGES